MIHNEKQKVVSRIPQERGMLTFALFIFIRSFIGMMRPKWGCVFEVGIDVDSGFSTSNEWLPRIPTANEDASFEEAEKPSVKNQNQPRCEIDGAGPRHPDQ